MNLKHELEALVDALAAAGVDHAICGGIAVTIHGAPRFTKDIDLLVPDEALAEAVRVARTCGFDLPAAPMVFGADSPNERHIQRITKTEERDLLTLDLILVEPGFREVWDSRVLVRWEDRVVPVVSVEGLRTMKQRAGRPQDMLDLKNLGVDTGDDEDSANEDA